MQARIGVGAFVVHEGKVLLVKRGTSPARGQWAIPGGKLRYGESLQAAAEREIAEETGIAIRAGEIMWVFEAIARNHNGRISSHYVVIDLRATYCSGSLRPAGDAADAGWFAPEELYRLHLNERTDEFLRDIAAFLPPL